MHQAHRKQLLKALKDSMKAARASKREAKKQLVAVGIINSKGEVLAPYKNLCTPQKQA